MMEIRPFLSLHSNKVLFDHAKVLKYNLSPVQLYVFSGVTQRRGWCAVFIVEAISTMFIADFTVAHF